MIGFLTIPARHPSPLGLLAAATLSVFAPHSSLDAQEPSLPSAIVGVVRDQAGRPIGDADVLVYQLQMRARSRADGTFRFDLKPGKYTIEVRHLGYKAVTSKVTVKEAPLSVAIQMERVPFFLPSVLTTADRGGLSGVIADTAYKPVAKVRVTVLGANASAETDSAGAFFMPVKPGHYMVELKRDGYARQLVGVTVPETTGRKLAAWMVPTKNADPREGAMLFDLPHRVNMANVVWDKFYTREDMEALNVRDVRMLTSNAAMKLSAPDCKVFINGDQTKWMPMWTLKTEDVEFVEVHIAKPDIPKGDAASSTGGSNDKLVSLKKASSGFGPPESSDCPATVIAWLRK